MATFFAVPEDDFTLLCGKPKAFHYIANSGKGLNWEFPLSARLGVTPDDDQQQKGA